MITKQAQRQQRSNWDAIGEGRDKRGAGDSSCVVRACTPPQLSPHHSHTRTHLAHTRPHSHTHNSLRVRPLGWVSQQHDHARFRQRHGYSARGIRAKRI